MSILLSVPPGEHAVGTDKVVQMLCLLLADIFEINDSIVFVLSRHLVDVIIGVSPTFVVNVGDTPNRTGYSQDKGAVP